MGVRGEGSLVQTGMLHQAADQDGGVDQRARRDQPPASKCPGGSCPGSSCPARPYPTSPCTIAPPMGPIGLARGGGAPSPTRPNGGDPGRAPHPPTAAHLRHRGGAPPRRDPRRPGLAPVGAVPQRAAMGHRARGLQRRRRRLGLPSRTTTPARAPTAGARTASPASATSDQRLCLSLALWNGRDPILKERLFGLTNARGQPRRGRQGAVLLPRRHADALPTCGCSTSTRRARSRTRGSSTRTRRRGRDEPRVRAARHRRLRRGPLLRRRPSSTPRPAPTTC